MESDSAGDLKLHIWTFQRERHRSEPLEFQTSALNAVMLVLFFFFPLLFPVSHQKSPDMQSVENTNL